MGTVYQHRQIGWVISLVMASGVLAVAIIAALAAPRSPILFIVLPSAVITALTGALFCSMTVQLGDAGVSWHFGPGFWRKTLDWAEIEKAMPIKTKWYWGYGIKFFGPGRWLYNVSGTDAVELQLRKGGWVRLGTDDVSGLMQALRARGL